MWVFGHLVLLCGKKNQDFQGLQSVYVSKYLDFWCCFVVQNFICHNLQIHQESIFSMLVVWIWHLKLNARSLYSFEVLVCVNVQSLDFLLKPLCRSDFCCHPVVVWTDTEVISHVHWYDTSSIELKPTWIATISYKNFPQSQQFIASVLICSAHLLCRCWYCWH